MSDYMPLATALLAACGSDFDQAQLKAVVASDHSNLEYQCITNGNIRYATPSADLGWKAHEALQSLQQSMKQEGREPWARCTFTLSPDGRFKFDVEYDD